MHWAAGTFISLTAVGAIALVLSTLYVREFVANAYEQYRVSNEHEPNELEIDLDPGSPCANARGDGECNRIVCWSCSTRNDPDFYFCRQCGERLMHSVVR